MGPQVIEHGDERWFWPLFGRFLQFLAGRLVSGETTNHSWSEYLFGFRGVMMESSLMRSKFTPLFGD
jgi:hypothetical protein